MNKKVVGGFFLLLLIILALFMVFKVRSPFGKSNSSFASEPTSEITKIEFSENEKSLRFEKEGDQWLLNDSLETRKSSLFFLESVLLEMKIKSPVSAELFSTEIIEKGIHPVRVKVFEKRKLLNSFLVYKTTSNNYGNIMKKREGAKSFIVYIPGFEDDIGSLFNLNDLYWQPFTVFNLLPSEISSVTFENLSDTSLSFIIHNRNHLFTLSAINGELSGWDSSLVRRYISYFTRVPFEKYALDLGPEEKSSIESQQPLYRIKVVTSQGVGNTLILWERTTGNDGSKDSDRLWGRTEKNKEFMIMKYFDIDPLIKKRSYFFPN